MAYQQRVEWPTNVLDVIGFTPTLAMVGTGWYHDVNASVLNGAYVPRDFQPTRANNHGHNFGTTWGRDNNFDVKNSNYLQDLLVMGIVIVCLGVTILLCIPVVHCCLAKVACCCRREKVKPFSKSKARYGYVVASVATLAFAMTYAWGLVLLNKNINQWEDSVYQIADAFGAVNGIADNIIQVIIQALTSLGELNDAVETCANVTTVVLERFHNFTYNTTQMENRVNQGVDFLTAQTGLDFIGLENSVNNMGDTISNTDKWRQIFGYTLLALLIVVMLAYVVAGWVNFFALKPGARTSKCASRFSCLASPVALMVVVAAFVVCGASVVLAAASGDYCQDPDGNTQTTVDSKNGNSDVSILVNYYTTCNDSAVPIEEYMYQARRGVAFVVRSVGPVLDTRDLIPESVIEQCPDLAEVYDLMEEALLLSWFGVLKLSLLVECPIVNALYDLVAYQTFCLDLGNAVYVMLAGALGLTVSLAATILLHKLMVMQKRVEEDQEALTLLGEEADGVDMHMYDGKWGVPGSLGHNEGKYSSSELGGGGGGGDDDDGGGGGDDDDDVTSPLRHPHPRRAEL